MSSKQEVIDFLVCWSYDGNLQTFESRERFRKGAAELIQRIRNAPETSVPTTDWKKRAEEAEGILSHNMALANATTRRTMNERNAIIQRLRERYSAAEIADMVGLTRQRIHQILNEAPVEGSVHGSHVELSRTQPGGPAIPVSAQASTTVPGSSAETEGPPPMKITRLDPLCFDGGLGEEAAKVIGRLETALRFLMQAYERRIRSECTPEQLKQEPWRCMEWEYAHGALGVIAARSALKANCQQEGASREAPSKELPR